MKHIINCSWVPGTMNRVRVQIADSHYIVSLDVLERIRGKKVVSDLYLTGRSTIELGDEAFRNLLPQAQA